jgi:Ca2+-binding EF-hand superfamily protein
VLVGYSCEGVRRRYAPVRHRRAPVTMEAREWERHRCDTDTKNTQVRGGQAWDRRGSMNRNWELLFKRLDSDKSGRLDYDEFERAVRSELRVTDTTDQELKALWTYVDHDKSGEVTINEFQHGCYLLVLEGWPLLSKDSLEKIVAIINGAAKRWLHASSWVTVFRAIDQDENDRLGYDELERVVRANGTQGGLSLTTSDLTDNDLRGLWRALDRDVSGEVTIDEFMNFMRRKAEKPKTPPPPPKSRRRRRAPSPDSSIKTQDTAATTTVPAHVGDYLSTSTTLDNIQRETGCKLSQTKNEVTFAGSDFQIRAARVESCVEINAATEKISRRWRGAPEI